MSCFSLLFWLLLPLTHAFLLNITSPAQCSEVTASWTGGTPPYEILLVPVGHVKPEIRAIINYQNITASPFSFPLTFPAYSQFIAVLSDSTGSGSGGTTDVLTVQPSPSNDVSCLRIKEVAPEFYFYLNPPAPIQCAPIEISWPETIVGISVWAVIPGGPTFAIPLPNITDANADILDSTGWTVDIKAGMQMLLVAGNNEMNGRGKGGSTDLLTVGVGSNRSQCLDGQPAVITPSPSQSTPTTPLGGSRSGTVFTSAPAQSTHSSGYLQRPSTTTCAILSSSFALCFAELVVLIL